MPEFTRLRYVLLAQVGHLFPWVPVLLGCGIGVFFLLRFEPDRLIWIVFGSVVFCVMLARFSSGIGRCTALAVALVGLGFCFAALRTHAVAEPVLGFRYYGPVEGRIIAIDRSASNALRLALDRVVLHNTPPARTPARVRVSLHGDQSHFEPRAGDTIGMAAHLSPPSGPVEPGGFDFQRHAWFQKLGGVGYTRNPVMVLSPWDGGKRVLQIRQSLGQHVISVLGPRLGGFANALVTGDRTYIEQSDLEILRDTNLAHLLAISGLHMGLLTAVVFAAVRGGGALLPSVSMRLPIKQIAAVCALLAATLYLLLSGGAVATERAYIMVGVALVAILLKQRAISLRAVAVAAIIVLLRTPEAVLSPGFQMSFAATTALVAVFAGLREADLPLGRKWLRPLIAVVLTSAVAGAATAPFGAAHFNQVSQWGLLANVLSVPLMGTVVMPGIVLAALLAPFGADWIGLYIAGAGLSWILFVAESVAALPMSVRYVQAPNLYVLPLFALGGLICAIWQGKSRFIGVAIVGCVVLFWNAQERPYALISDNGGIVGVMTDTGRALSRERSSQFVASVWLENDGDGRSQSQAHGDWPVQGELVIHHVTGKKASAAFTECKAGQIVVSNAVMPQTLPCTRIDAARLRETGSIAIAKDGQITTARQVHGARIWNTWGADQ